MSEELKKEIRYLNSIKYEHLRFDSESVNVTYTTIGSYVNLLYLYKRENTANNTITYVLVNIQDREIYSFTSESKMRTFSKEKYNV